MKSYNWREERKKYQTSINATQDAPQEAPAEQPAAQPAPAAQEPVQQAAPQPAPQPAPQSAPAAPAEQRKFPVIAVVAIVAVALIAVVFMLTRKSDPKPVPAPIQQVASNVTGQSLPDQPAASYVSTPANTAYGPRDSALLLQKQSEKHQYAVGVVANCVERKNGKKIIIAVGTAWAFDTNKFATNAHVALGTKDQNLQIKKAIARDIISQEKNIPEQEIDKYMQQIGEAQAAELMRDALSKAENDIRSEDVIIMINGAAGESYSVSHVQLHRNYGRLNTKVDPDIAVLTINGSHKNYFKIADQKKLYALKPGIAVAFLGFPTEMLADNNLNLDSPVATMQTGIITSVTDFYYKDSGVRNNHLIRHNLPATGGASGSPVFDADGEVVALLYAVTMNVGIQTVNGVIQRTPHAAQINFAVRADLMRGMGRMMTLREFLN